MTVAFPKLSLEEANRILTETEGPGGGFLDDGSAFGVYSRLNLYAARGPRGRALRRQALEGGVHLAPALPASAQFARAKANGLIKRLGLDDPIGAEVPEPPAQLAPCDQ